MAGLSFAAAIVLGYLAYRCLQSALGGHGTNGEEQVSAPADGPSKAEHYATGLLLTALNPMTLGFWFVAVPAAVANLTGGARTDLPLVCRGVSLFGLS